MQLHGLEKIAPLAFWMPSMGFMAFLQHPHLRSATLISEGFGAPTMPAAAESKAISTL